MSEPIKILLAETSHGETIAKLRTLLAQEDMDDKTIIIVDSRNEETIVNKGEIIDLIHSNASELEKSLHKIKSDMTFPIINYAHDLYDMPLPKKPRGRKTDFKDRLRNARKHK